MEKFKQFLKTTLLLITAYLQRVFYRRTIQEQDIYIHSLQSGLDYTKNELRAAKANLQAAVDKVTGSQIVQGGLKSENKRLADQVMRQAAQILSAETRAGAAKEELDNEKIGFSALDDTNRALEKRLQNILADMFPKGPGMYMINFDEKTRQAYPFKIPQKLQKQITKILTDSQKTALKKKKL